MIFAMFPPCLAPCNEHTVRLVETTIIKETANDNAQTRSVTLKSPEGAGSQFVSFILPGESCWIHTSSDPSGLYVNGIHPAMLYRFIGLATRKLWASYIVSDQNALGGGIAPLSKRSV